MRVSFGGLEVVRFREDVAADYAGGDWPAWSAELLILRVHQSSPSLVLARLRIRFPYS